MNIFSAANYLKYILLSKHKKGHGIHSPFVFDLVTRVFRYKSDSDLFSRIKLIRQKMISDKRSIIVNDLGSGSEKRKTNIRKVSDIARYSPVPEKYGVLLSSLAMEFGAPLIVEFGTSFGISTMYLAGAKSDTLVHTMEGCPSTAGIAVSNFKEGRFDNIRVLCGSFEELLPEIVSSKIKPGLVFIDGDHRKEPVLKYFRSMTEISDNNTVIVIDDIYYSREMYEAWNEIKQTEGVSLTVDIFRMGIVFFRKGISRNNYLIRY